MRRLQIITALLGLAAVTLLAAGWALTQGIRSNLNLEITEQLQIEDYLLLSAEMTTLYSEYGRLIASQTTVDPTEIETLRRRVDALLLSIQTQIARREAAVPNASMVPGQAAGEELLNLALGIERTLSEVERAESLIATGALDQAEIVLRETLDARLAGELLPAIEAAIARETTRQEAALRRINRLLTLAQSGVVALAALLGLAALVLWLAVVRSQRMALADLERAVERLAGGLAPQPDALARHPELTGLSAAISSLALARDAQDQKLSVLSRELATTETSLRSEQDSLRQIDQVRRDFLADVSHELRTPLTVLRGVAEVSLRARAPSIEDMRAAMERIVDEAGHVSRIVEDLFFIARSRAGGLNLRTDIVDLSEALAATARQAETLTAQGDASVDWSVPAGEILVEGDLGRLRQLFTILLDNALKYGGRRPRIRSHATLADAMVVIEVRDHGPGVPEDDLPHIFDRLYRGAASTRAAPQGSGLGLPMARSIVAGHGGTITMTNAEDGGARVTVQLPIFDEEAPE